MNLFLRVGSKNNSCIRETQENSIEFLVQSSLPYIPLLMVHTTVLLTYSKGHVLFLRSLKVNMCCSCCMISLHSPKSCDQSCDFAINL